MKYILSIAFLLFCAASQAQIFPIDSATQEPILNREVSVNLSPLLVQMIPFNRQIPSVTGPYNISFKRYFSPTRALRFSLGAILNPSGAFGGAPSPEAFLNHFNARIGLVKDKALTQKWFYGSSWNVYTTVGDFNVAGSKLEDNLIGFGLGPGWEIAYHFSPNVSLSTETFLFFGVKQSGFAFQIIPPVALNLSIRFEGDKN